MDMMSRVSVVSDLDSLWFSNMALCSLPLAPRLITEVYYITTFYKSGEPPEAGLHKWFKINTRRALLSFTSCRFMTDCGLFVCLFGFFCCAIEQQYMIKCIIFCILNDYHWISNNQSKNCLKCVKSVALQKSEQVWFDQIWLTAA